MSILSCPLGSHFPVDRIEINKEKKQAGYALCFFTPFLGLFPGAGQLFLGSG